ncbi:hypothetical protein [Bradyrhizobium sp.]|uniref:hypothetical protein n=1 Tax=Bradyrhizobium sp. TaxID=376 RepID=UPI0025BEB909|nr:hypothetical protein [Bradyrhizobium sp.]
MSPQTAAAQPLPNDCLASFKTKPDKFIVYYGWLPGGSGVVNAMTCTRAEVLREQLFKPGGAAAFSDADIQTALAYDSPAVRAKQLLQQKINELRNDKPSNLRLWFDTQMIAISKTQILIGCLAIETGVGAGLCGLGALQFVVAAYDLWDKLPGGPAEQQRNTLIAEMEKAIRQLDMAIADGITRKNSLNKAKQLLHSAQVGLCVEIKKSCL